MNDGALSLPSPNAAAVLKDGLSVSDADFAAAAKRIIEKNRELYERLR